MPDLSTVVLESVRYRFAGQKDLADRAIAQLGDEHLIAPIGNDEANCVAVIVRHLHGNMMSRWTEFLTSDGEKPWRDRDGEFRPGTESREALLAKWEDGWARLFGTLDALAPEDLLAPVTIRGLEYTAFDAMTRGLAHVSYHVGQIVLIAKVHRGSEWRTLSIAKGTSKAYRPSGRE